MGLFKSIKDMKDMTAAAPGLVESATRLGAQAQAQAAAMQQLGAQGYVDGVNAASYGEPTPEALEPIAGVDLETYATVVKGIAAFGYDAARLPEVAATHGIGAEDWSTAQTGWGERIQADRALGARFNLLYGRA
jgi:hypothetical protein